MLPRVFKVCFTFSLCKTRAVEKLIAYVNPRMAAPATTLDSRNATLAATALIIVAVQVFITLSDLLQRHCSVLPRNSMHYTFCF